MAEWLTGVGAYQRTYAGQYVATAWLDEALVTWCWSVESVDRHVGSGTADTEEAAKDAAMRMLIKAAGRVHEPPGAGRRRVAHVAHHALLPFAFPRPALRPRPAAFARFERVAA